MLGVQFVAVQLKHPSVPGGPTTNVGFAGAIVNVVPLASALPAKQDEPEGEQVFCVVPAVPVPPYNA
jgi:hypothetical protein